MSRSGFKLWCSFGSKTHFNKDRRYKLDHEEVVFTSPYDQVEISAIPVDLRAEWANSSCSPGQEEPYLSRMR